MERVLDVSRKAAAVLQERGIEQGRLDAELLLAGVLGIRRLDLYLQFDRPLSPDELERYRAAVRRRLKREPVQYILGTAAFRNLELHVDRRVLIPRPETELLVELALEARPASVLDVGTGSGAIALAVADELPGCEVTATDTSAGALEVARANAERLGFSDRVRFLEGTLPEGETFDLILANLPYVAERDWPSLQPEVTQWEPREALLAGPDGLAGYRALISTSAGLYRRIANIRSGGLAVEVGEGQAPAVAALMRDAGFDEIPTTALH